MAKRTAVAEDPSCYAIDRSLWHLHEAFCTNDPSLCQHDGRTCDYFVLHLRDLHDLANQYINGIYLHCVQCSAYDLPQLS